MGQKQAYLDYFGENSIISTSGMSHSHFHFIVQIQCLDSDMRNHLKLCKIASSYTYYQLYWRMHTHPLSELIQDFTHSLALTGLQLQTLTHFYLAPKPSHPPQNPHAQFEVLIRQECSSWSDKQRWIMGEMLKNDLARKGAENLYIDMYVRRMRLLNLDVGFNDARLMAIQHFNKLEINQQIPFLALYLRDFQTNESSQSSASGWESQAGQLYGMGSKNSKTYQNVLFFDGLSSTYFPLLSKNGGIESYLSRQPSKSTQGEGFKLQNRGLEGEYVTNKNDMYKLGSREKQERQASKGEEGKDKVEFQTLKSLFKKLQNNP